MSNNPFAWKYETHEEESTVSSNNQATVYLEAVIEAPEDSTISDGVVVIREPSQPSKANLKLVFDLETGALLDARKD